MEIDNSTSDLHIAAALRVAGPEDCSKMVVQSVTTVNGRFAAAIVRLHMPNDKARAQRGLDDEPVRIARGSYLEILCNGYYLEVQGVRSLLYRAARIMRNGPVFSS